MFHLFQLWRLARNSGRGRSALAHCELQKFRRARQRFLRPVVEQLEARWLLANILVTTHLDIVNPIDTETSLREAVIQANNQTTNPGHDTITFASSLAAKTVFLQSGPMTISDPLTIQGPGAAQTTVDGESASRLFDITSAAGDVTFDRLMLSGGKTTADNEAGGAIRSVSAGLLTIQNSTVSGNSTAGRTSHGGSIFAQGSLAVTNSTVSGNSTKGGNAYGGGIHARGSLTVTNSTVSGNSTFGSNSAGGGIFAQGSLRVTNSTIYGNSTRGAGLQGRGGGIFAYRSLTVINSTITGNSISSASFDVDGGGIFCSFGPVTIRNSIVSGNSDADGSHPDLRQYNNGPPIVQFSLIGNNTGAGVPEGSGNLIGIDPLLGPLADNGGPTRTHRPLVGSPVIDAGSNGLAVDPVAQEALTTDQRGASFVRIADGPDADTTATVDMGAFELAATPFALLVTTANDELDPTHNAADLSLREAIALANGGLGADTITFAAALAGQPIQLSMGQMSITDPLTIRGLGAGQTTVNGQNAFRLFDITSAAGDVTFDGLTLTAGKTTAPDEKGGAIRSVSAGKLTIQNSTISGNSTVGLRANGGGIFAQGSVAITNSTISGNSTAGSRAYGGGIATFGSLTVTNSTISGNATIGYAAAGGGIAAAGSLTVTNSTISGNSTKEEFGNGGGIWASSQPVTITNSTITGNSVADADADGGGAFSSSGSVTIRNSIVAGNLDKQNGSHPDLRVVGALNVQFSLIGDNNGNLGLTNGASGNLVGTHAAPLNPQLGPLQNNGGPTQTHALIVSSPALNAGDPGFVVPPTTDQRGAPLVRVADGPDADSTARIDMGAFEFQTVIPSNLVVDIALDENDGNYAAGDVSLRDAVALANASSGLHTITFAPALAGQPVLLILGQMSITDPLTIRGLGAGQTTVIGSSTPQLYSRLFDITNTAGAVTFDGLTLTGGKTTANFEIGGALRSLASNVQVNIQNSTISGNSTAGSSGAGGGIQASGPLTVSNSTISGNSTIGSGAGGGGISANGPVTVTNSTISGNSTNGLQASGGGMSAFGTVTISNSTISGNFTIGNNSHGGAIYARGSPLTVTNSTITGNSVAGSTAYGGGVFGASFFSYEGGFITEVTIRNSIVAGNRDIQDGSHPDVVPGGVPLTVRYSLIGDNSGSGLTQVPVGTPDPSGNGNLIGGGTDPTRINPQLGPLANNGGLTLTHALCTAAGAPHASCTVASPALNAGSIALIPADTFDLDGDGNAAEPIPFDQRGPPFKRVVETTVDMGALESQPAIPWHNFAKPFDVNGDPNNTPDDHIVAGDALAIINYLNAFGAGPIPANPALGQPYGFVDTSGGPNGVGDNFITAGDALDIINFLNAGFGGEGESAQSVQGDGDLLTLLALDLALHPKRRRS